MPLDTNVQDFRKIIQTAKDKVFPAVVFLMPTRESYEGGKKVKQLISGSGVMISAEGECVTNWHVVDKAVSIRCLLYNGLIGTAKVIGTDKDTDLALVKITVPGQTKFPFATLGDSRKVEAGQFVMAMGAPWGLSRSVSLGIVSCTTRSLSTSIGMYNLWIQTDASINPGNSGGPLVNTKGAVIGINTRGTNSGGDMAFAIPSNVVKRITTQIRKYKKVKRSWVGLRLQPLKDFERNSFYEAKTGVLVASVDAGSPAMKAKLKIGDLLLVVAGKPVKGINREDIPAINQMLADLEEGKAVPVKIRRGGKELTITMTPHQKGEVEGEDFDCRRWNMTVKAINKFSTPALHFFQAKGVYVLGVKYPGNAVNSQLHRSDILLKIAGKSITTLADLKKVYKEIIADKKRKERVNILIKRGGVKRYVVLDYTTKYGQD